MLDTAGRSGPVLPNLFRGIGGAAGVESGGESSPKTSGGHAARSSGAIMAGSEEIGGAGDEGRRFWAGALFFGSGFGGEDN